MADAGSTAVPGASGERMRLAGAATSEAFTRVYAESFREVSAYCTRLLRDESLARDVTQEAFVRLFSRWRSVAEPRAFVFIVATNLVRDEWRRRTRQNALIDGLKPLVHEQAAGHAVELADVVARLPRRLRDVVVLHLVADLPVLEVARVLTIPEGTVKRRLHEARALLRLDWLEVS